MKMRALAAVLGGVLAVAGCAAPRPAAPVAGSGVPLSANVSGSAPGSAPPGTTPSGIGPSGSARPSATPSTPGRTPRPSATAGQPVTPVSSTRKGVSAWSFDGVDKALQLSGASWYYTWSTSHSGITAPHGVAFVPMIWGPGSVTTAALAQAKAAGGSLLGFNEPDLGSQSNMTVAQALDLWPKLQATGLRMGSPAVAWGGADAGGWLDSFMAGAASRGLRVDFVTLHWYGSDFRSAAATSQLKSYLRAVWQRYHKPIWLTEYALIKFASGGSQYPTGAQQAAFVTSSTAMLDGLPYLERYAWFALPATPGSGTGLFAPGAVATEAGRAYQKAR